LIATFQIETIESRKNNKLSGNTGQQSLTGGRHPGMLSSSQVKKQRLFADAELVMEERSGDGWSAGILHGDSDPGCFAYLA
jgi:hypothetical protein